MSPISTSEPPPLPERASPVPAPTPTRSLLRAVFLDVLLAFVALFVASILLGVPVLVAEALRVSGGDIAGVDFEALQHDVMPQLTAASVFATLLAALATWWARSRRLPVLAAMRAHAAYPLAIVSGALIQLACLGISVLSAHAGVPIEPSNVDPLQELDEATPWLFWLVVVVVAPAAEELLFRHVLLRRFAVAGRALLGVAVTSLLFALLHEPVPTGASWLVAVALYTAMGAGFSAVYLRTGRLGAAIAAHATCNLVALSLAFSGA